MESTALSVGKSVLDGAIGYAKSAIAEEVALQLGIQRDHAFIRDELQMMRAFLMAAHDEDDKHQVRTAWVKQVRDVAYDAEDCLQEFSIHLKDPSWWRLPRTLRERRRIAKQMKEMRARVEDVSQRNMRYQLIKGTDSKPATTTELSSITAKTIFGIDEARRAAKQEEPQVDLVHMINMEGKDLRVIAVWGTSGDLGLASIIRAAYENQDVKRKFPCRAWIRVMKPFNPKVFVQSLVKQFNSAVGVDALLDRDKTCQELVEEFNRYVNEMSYLVVLNDLSVIEEWDEIRTCFPNNNKGSRIIVSTEQVEVASLCAGHESVASELKQLSADQTIYAFYRKDSQDPSELPMSMSNSAKITSGAIVPTKGMLANQCKSLDRRKSDAKKLTRIRTVAGAFEESHLIGRKKENYDVSNLISQQHSEELCVISVWGMGGLGKTTLIKDIFESQKLAGMFEKRACVTVMRPFVLEDLLKSLIKQLNVESSQKKAAIDVAFGTRSTTLTMRVEEPSEELSRLLKGKKCLIVLDDVSSIAEWDHIIRSFPKFDNTCRIVVTTREESIARHCSEKQENIYKLKVLAYNDALDLFMKKVFKEDVDLAKHPQLIEEAKQILKKCNGLPLAIVTIGGFLSNQPKMAVEWRKLNQHMSTELAMNQKLEDIRTILGKSYEGLPHHLKSCFLYMSVFPEDHKISRRRLIQRWIAEGYSRELRDISAKLMADSYFMELIQRSMILPSQQSIHSRKGIDSCQVHDLMREISISKSGEENLVYRMVEGCSSNTQEIVRHLAIDNNWNGDQRYFENIVDLSRVRSLTVFGKWRPFYISEKMRLLRVLDLEDTSGLENHDLVHIGKFLHLKYLSIRGCDNVFGLPDSLGNLRQLQTLDIVGTDIVKLPATITKLRKLQYLRCGNLGYGDTTFLEKIVEDMPNIMHNKLYALTFFSVFICVKCCAPQFLDDPDELRLCTACCCFILPHAMGLITPGCVVVPSGIWKMKALQTLGIVNLARGRSILQEIRRLTNLRKLGVAGINMKNSKEFCLALADLCNLESLLVWSMGKPGLQGCLDDLSSPPKRLQSLKLYGNLVKLPEWFRGLHNLVKLVLRSSMISEHDAAMQVLGELPNLTIMRLMENSFQGKELFLCFRLKAFLSLMVLELAHLDNLKWVKFEARASTEIEERASPEIEEIASTDEIEERASSKIGETASLEIGEKGSTKIEETTSLETEESASPEIEERAGTEIEETTSTKIEETARGKLEVIQFSGSTDEAHAGLFSGLEALPSLKEFMLPNNDEYRKDFLEEVQAQLAQNPNEPALRRY